MEEKRLVVEVGEMVEVGSLGEKLGKELLGEYLLEVETLGE